MRYRDIVVLSLSDCFRAGDCRFGFLRVLRSAAGKNERGETLAGLFDNSATLLLPDAIWPGASLLGSSRLTKTEVAEEMVKFPQSIPKSVFNRLRWSVFRSE